MRTFVDRSPQRAARLAGVLYLAIIVLGVCGELVVRNALVVPGDAAATARAIGAHPLLWRAGIAGDLVMHVLDVPVIVLLYLLLRPVSESLALLATAFNLVQTAVLATNKLALLVPIFVLQDASVSQAFAPAEQQAWIRLALQVHGHGFGVGLVFFGCGCLVRAVLIYRCGFLPRTLGLLIGLAGLSYLVNSFALLLAPDFAAAIFPAVLMPAFVGELALSLWLIAKGVDAAGWAERQRPSPGAPLRH